MAPGLLPFILWTHPHADPISSTMMLVMVLIAIALGGYIFFGWNKIQRSQADGDRVGAVAGYALSVLACVFLFPASLEIAVTVLAILAFGDGTATFGGLYFGGPRLPWNSRKSWSGFLCFVGIGTFVATMMYWGESNNLEAETYPGVSLLTALGIGAAGAIAAALAESLPSKINDNIRVGVTAAVVVSAMHFWLVG